MKSLEQVESADAHLEVLVEALVQLQDCRNIAAPADMHAQASATGTIYPCGMQHDVPTVCTLFSAVRTLCSAQDEACRHTAETCYDQLPHNAAGVQKAQAPMIHSKLSLRGCKMQKTCL